MVMKLMEAGSLRKVLDDRSVQLSWPEQHTIALGISYGLGLLHSMGILHRDLKSHNILLRRDGSGNWQAKLSDFGLAKAKSSSPTHTKGSSASALL